LTFCPECGRPVEGDPDAEPAAAAPQESSSAFGKFKSSAAGFLKRP
jgi:hypothetical protein